MHAHEIERLGFLSHRNGRAFDLHQQIDRHTFGMLGQARERRDHARAVLERFAHADDTAAAHIDPGLAHGAERVEPILIVSGW